jgi:hypothetical protein
MSREKSVVQVSNLHDFAEPFFTLEKRPWALHVSLDEGGSKECSNVGIA